MSWPRHLEFKYHTQDIHNYCGAAVASMILAANNPAPILLDQENLWSAIQENNLKNLPRNWATEPQGLAQTINEQAQAFGLATNYAVNKPTDKEQGSKDILKSLYEFNRPAAALVFKSAHWIVVNGVQTDVEPIPGDTWNIEGFWVQNPFHHRPTDPPPHKIDDLCGTGSSLGDDDQFWTYTDDEWLRYFRGCQYDDSQTKFISVTPTIAPAVMAAQIEATEVQPSPPPPVVAMAPTQDGLKIISPQQAIEFSQIGLRRYNLFQYGFIDRALKNAVPGKPTLVNETDQLNAYYYLVPYEVGKAVIVHTKVDARFGGFRGLQLLNKPLPNPFLSKDRALKLILGKRFELPDVVGRVILFPGIVSVAPMLVWRPCLESMSPYLPFYQINVGPHVIYIRVDGEVFTKLTPAAFGGYPEVSDVTWPKKP